MTQTKELDARLIKAAGAGTLQILAELDAHRADGPAWKVDVLVFAHGDSQKLVPGGLVAKGEGTGSGYEQALEAAIGALAPVAE